MWYHLKPQKIGKAKSQLPLQPHQPSPQPSTAVPPGQPATISTSYTPPQKGQQYARKWGRSESMTLFERRLPLSLEPTPTAPLEYGRALSCKTVTASKQRPRTEKRLKLQIKNFFFRLQRKVRGCSGRLSPVLSLTQFLWMNVLFLRFYFYNTRIK